MNQDLQAEEQKALREEAPVHDDHNGDGHVHKHGHGNGDGHTHPNNSNQHHSHHNHKHGGIFGERTELVFALLCGAFLSAGFLAEKLTHWPQWIPMAAYVAAYLFGGWFTTKEAIHGIRHGQFEIDFLMLVAAAGAAALGEWPEGALLLFLFSLGHSLEHMAMEKARASIEALAGLAPKTALIRKNGEVKEVSVSALRRGDILLVKPNTRIPADAVVILGSSAVNQAPITGESIPVDKLPLDEKTAASLEEKKIPAQHRVFAGTINGTGALELMTLREASDSTLSRLLKLVRDAEKQQSPTQQFTKKIERYYVPAVLIVVLLLLFAWVVIDEPFSKSFYRAMAVLVAASPCALAISTPSAVLSGVARAAKQGVLIKGGRPLEDLGMVTAMAFDKTGTLTEGKPVLNAVVPIAGASREELLETAIAVEALSDHPLAAAIVKDGSALLGHHEIAPATDFKAVTGKGLEARVNGHLIRVGNDELFRSTAGGLPEDILQQVQRLQREGNTTMVVQKEERFLGVLGVMDLPRAEAAEVISALTATGIRKMVMLTGDNQRVADAVAGKIGITDARGDLLPEEKLDAIKQLRLEENALAMVGDGVNDAPAMANSTVGIAMGAAGSDVALEAADIALMADRLDNLPFAIGLSRKSRTIIRQNLFISLGMVAILVPLTILGYAKMGPAVMGHEGSTMIVVLNALRLLGYKQK